MTEEKLLASLRKLSFEKTPTRWINQEAMLSMTSFGKKSYFYDPKKQPVQINTIHNPVLYRYYLNGGWDLY
jgi:spermidine synthase